MDVTGRHNDYGFDDDGSGDNSFIHFFIHSKKW